MKSLILFSQTGCLLPLLMFLNLAFGWMFFKISTWFIIELVLILTFILNVIFVTRKVLSAVNKGSPRPGTIDIEGKVVEDSGHLLDSSS